MKSPTELEAFAKRFLVLLVAKPFGPYEATKFVFGEAVADSLGHDGAHNVAQYTAPARRQQPVMPRIRKTPHMEVIDISDSDDDLEVAHSTKRMRY